MPNALALASSLHPFEKARQRLCRLASALCRPCPDRRDCPGLPSRRARNKISWRRAHRSWLIRSSKNFLVHVPFVSESRYPSLRYSPFILLEAGSVWTGSQASCLHISERATGTVALPSTPPAIDLFTRHQSLSKVETEQPAS